MITVFAKTLARRSGKSNAAIVSAITLAALACGSTVAQDNRQTTPAIGSEGTSTRAAVIAKARCDPQAIQSAHCDELIREGRKAIDELRYSEAERLFSEALHQLEGAEMTDIRLARSLWGLGVVNRVAGRCLEAARLHLRAVKIFEAALPPHPFDLANAWEYLGAAYACEHQYSKAADAFRRSVDIVEKGFGAEHPSVVPALSSLGTAYTFQRRYAEAAAVLQRAQTILEKSPEPSQAVLAAVLNNLGELLRAMGRYGDAEEVLRKGLAVVENTSEPDSRLITTILLNNLGVTYMRHKQFREALPLFARAADLAQEGGVQDFHEAGQILKNYSLCLRKVGNKSEAQRYDSKSNVILGRAGGAAAEKSIVDVHDLTRKGDVF